MDILYVIIDELNTNPRVKYSVQHNMGRKLIEYAAKNLYHIENSEIEVINEKPRFKFSDKQFSISHSKNIVVVGFDDKPVGIDIEYIKQRNYKPIAERMNFQLKEGTLNEFYKCWTQYEAEYKLGCKPVSVKSQIFLNEYMLSVASVVDFDKTKIFNITEKIIKKEV